MSYSNPTTVTYTTGAITTTGAAVTIPLKGPKGMSGRLVDIIARCTTTHALGSTPTKLQVGITGTLEKYAAFLPPALTAPDVSLLNELPGASAVSDRNIAADH